MRRTTRTAFHSDFILGRLTGEVIHPISRGERKLKKIQDDVGQCGPRAYACRLEEISL